jgi:hypothetical protein
MVSLAMAMSVAGTWQDEAPLVSPWDDENFKLVVG